MHLILIVFSLSAVGIRQPVLFQMLRSIVTRLIDASLRAALMWPRIISLRVETLDILRTDENVNVQMSSRTEVFVMRLWR